MNDTAFPNSDCHRADYRAQLQRYARALALAHNDQISSDLPPRITLAHVKMFTDGNLDKRCDKLLNQVELLNEVYDDLEERVIRYIRTVPLSAYDTGCTDAEHFLEWLLRGDTPTAEQQDCIVCQRSRHAVEFLARENRLAHVRFQDLLSIWDRTARELEQNSNLRLHLNPIRVTATFQTRTLLDEEADVPARVLFFPVGTDIRTAVLEPAGESLIGRLEQSEPPTFDELCHETNDCQREELLDLCHELGDMGLVACG